MSIELKQHCQPLKSHCYLFELAQHKTVYVCIGMSVELHEQPNIKLRVSQFKFGSFIPCLSFDNSALEWDYENYAIVKRRPRIPDYGLTSEMDGAFGGKINHVTTSFVVEVV